ncbi:hypothetical protein L6452_35136 [Arctium lappa]|uniref:Uncharacterized protein n=1 Tax=Arctium lappa TaxID=4217 RepID=A0ACB8YLD0_ARCLA|nr:hypothetical protein L6452_35136 [Arctium lappa]
MALSVKAKQLLSSRNEDKGESSTMVGVDLVYVDVHLVLDQEWVAADQVQSISLVTYLVAIEVDIDLDCFRLSKDELWMLILYMP